ncbi:Uncharacterised protein [Mycobacterium tuberculosis]|nr:Uncharacterised protein [Mycobacterium tuberculosis]
MALEAQLSHAGLAGPAGQVAPDRALDSHFEVGRLRGGLSAVPAVGGQHGIALIGEHQQCAVGPAEA